MAPEPGRAGHRGRFVRRGDHTCPGPGDDDPPGGERSTRWPERHGQHAGGTPGQNHGATAGRAPRPRVPRTVTRHASSLQQASVRPGNRHRHRRRRGRPGRPTTSAPIIATTEHRAASTRVRAPAHFRCVNCSREISILYRSVIVKRAPRSGMRKDVPAATWSGRFRRAATVFWRQGLRRHR